MCVLKKGDHVVGSGVVYTSHFKGVVTQVFPGGKVSVKNDKGYIVSKINHRYLTKVPSPVNADCSDHSHSNEKWAVVRNSQIVGEASTESEAVNIAENISLKCPNEDIFVFRAVTVFTNKGIITRSL